MKCLFVEPEVGISFSPAGLLTPFHIGASFQLKKLGIIESTTALAGSRYQVTLVA